MEKHTNKKLFAGVLALSCAFVMSGCDPIEALPGNYEDSILSNVQVDTDENIMGKIYDILASNKNEKVLEKILNELATKKYGTYKDIVDAKENLNDAKSKYIDDHADFFKVDTDTEYGKTVDGIKAIRNARFDQFYNDIQKRVSEAFYNLITSGSYNDPDTGMFNEENLVIKLGEELWDLTDKASTDSYKKFYVTSELTKDNALEKLNSYIYSRTGKIDIGGGAQRDARGYIETKIFPQILKDKLVEQYIYDVNYSSLGRSYARNVNYIKVAYDSSSLDYVKSLLKNFTTDYIGGTANGTDEALKFDIVDKAVRGFEKINTTGALLTFTADASGYANFYSTNYANSFAYNKNFVGNSLKDEVVVNISENAEYFTTLDQTQVFDKTVTSIKFFPDTKLGALLDSYNKAIKASKAGIYAKAEDKTELDKFDGKSLADALKDKIVALAKEDNTTDGWFVKNGGISEVPSALRDRLFNINVANDLDKKPEDGGYVVETNLTDGKYRYVDGDSTKGLVKKTPYVRNINGKKLIMPSNAIDFSLDNNNFIYKDGSAFYILQVIEAPSNPKLRLDAKNPSYTLADNSVDVITIENFAREIAKVLSTKDTYITNAYTKYLEDYDFLFSDTSLYEYFESQYPDLFDDED